MNGNPADGGTTVKRNYLTPREIKDHFGSITEWAWVRETHPAVATAIIAIADSKRDPQAIWEAPTDAEWDHVKMAVQEYVAHGDFEAEADGRYSWGEEVVKL